MHRLTVGILSMEHEMDCLLVSAKQRAGAHMVCMLVLPEPEDWSMHGLHVGISRTRGLEHA